MIVRELLSKLGFVYEDSGAKKADAAFKGLEKALGFVQIAAVAAAGAISAAVLETAKTSDEIKDQASRLGETTQGLQELQWAAKTSGSSAEALGTGLKFLSRNIYEASTGGKEAQEAFASLGLKIRDEAGKLKKPSDLFVELAEKIKATEDPNKRTALSMKLLGRSGDDLIPLLREGAEGIAFLRDEANRLGIVLDTETVEAGDRTWEALERVHMIVLGLGRTLAGPILEALAPVLEGFVEWVKTNRALIKTNVVAFAQGLVKTLKTMIEIVSALAKAWKAIAVVIATGVFLSLVAANGGLLQMLVNWALNTAAAVAYGAVSIATAAKAAAAWLASVAPLVIATALLAALILLANDVWVTLQGGDSLISRFGPKWTAFLDSWTKTSAEDPWWLRMLKEGVKAITDIEATWLRFEKAVQGAVGTPAAALILKQLNPLWNPDETFLARGLAPSTGGGGGNLSSSADANFTTGGGRASKVSVQMPISIQASPGMDEEQLASHVANKVDTVLQSRLSDLNASFEPAR